MAEIWYKLSDECDFSSNTLLTFSTKPWLTPHNQLPKTWEMTWPQSDCESERSLPKNGTCTSETNLYPYTSHSVARCVGPIQSSRGVGLHGHINFPILSVSDLSQRSMPVIMHNMLWCTKQEAMINDEYTMSNTYLNDSVQTEIKFTNDTATFF